MGTLRRREFMKVSAGAAGAALVGGTVRAADDGLDHRNERADRMTYRKLGKTNFMCGRVVFGCGAALAGGKAGRLLERAFDQGVNHFDVGYDDYYKGSEKNLAEFYKRHRGEVWITSKAPARTQPGAPFDATQARAAADYWLGQLDLSLERLGAEYVDAYYVMGTSNPDLLKSDEIRGAFRSAKAAGKVGHFGISTHQNARACLETVTGIEDYSLAMIAITPAGWYDYSEGKLLSDGGEMKDLRPTLDRAREAGIGLVGMKAARYIATAPYGGIYGKVADDSITTSFDHLYGEKLMNAELSPYQRSYAYVLEHGLDVVNSDMQNFKHFEENLAAARSSHEYFG